MRRSTERLMEEVKTLTFPDVDHSIIKVSNLSFIYDPVWNFTRDLIHRPRTVSDAKLTVNWKNYPFSLSLRKEIQHIFCLYYVAPKSLSGRGYVKPNTLCAKIKRSLSFLSAVVDQLPRSDIIETLADIEPADLRLAVRKFCEVSAEPIRQGLMILFSPQAGKILRKEFRTNLQDIKRLEFRPRARRRKRDNTQPSYLSDSLFSFLSDAATARVQDFLHRMNLEPEDTVTYKYKAPRAISQIVDFSEIFWVYEQIRRIAKNIPISDEKHIVLRIRLEKFNLKQGDMRDYLAQINTAAQCVIALYVGARYSELASIKADCITEKDGVKCIMGRVFKSKADSLKYDDAWVAIPAVRDAVRALEKLARLKNKEYLFTSLETATGKKGDIKGVLSYSSGGFAKAISLFLDAVDTKCRFVGWKFNTHQFRHSLVRQMIKAKLGLPYISFHLKHLHGRVASMPSDITLTYGNASKLIQSQMAGYHLEDIRRDIVRKLYDPDSIIQGGAAKAFDKRRKAYFEGMTDSGMTKEEIIDSIAGCASPAFVNVGLGYCTGRKANPKDGSQPPCIGSLRCNPNKCANAIVTEDHIPAWEKVLFENRKMAIDPRFAYVKVELEAAILEAKDVLNRLGKEL